MLKMRGALLFFILMSCLASGACSYVTDFVVINTSESPVEISYKFKPAPEAPPIIKGNPVFTSASKVESKEKGNWQDIATDRYEIDQATRTVKVKLQAQEALFITRMHHYFGPDDPNDVKGFPVEELSIVGSTGNLNFSGKQLLKAFSERSRVLYTLTYQ